MRNYIEHTGESLLPIVCGRLYKIVNKNGLSRTMKFAGISVTDKLLENGGFFMNFIARDRSYHQVWVKDIAAIYDYKPTKGK